MPRPHLLNYSLDSLTAELTKLHMPAYRAKQIFEWVFVKRAQSFDAMTNLSLQDREILKDSFDLWTAQRTRHLIATDATEKLLLRWPDEELTESVMIPADEDAFGEEGQLVHRRTACLSTQVGCPVRCAFCASGLEGLHRNLTVGQVVEQALTLAHLLPPQRRISNVVFMGMGEPLANLDTTLAALKTLMAPWGFHISGRKITISTVGLPPQIRKLADLELTATLAISLHASNDHLRQQIIPWAKGISINDLVEAGRYYFEKTGRELTLEYILLDGVNTATDQARELAHIAREMRANVNLIYYNEVPELPFRRPSGPTALHFQNQLRSLRINAHIRRSRGREIAAACGQLARQDKLVQLATPAPSVE